jgi:hypothetical protein
MRYRVYGLAALGAAAVAAGCGATHAPTRTASAPMTVSCVGYFAAHVRTGPDAGRGYHGDIAMTIPPGSTAPRAMLALYGPGARPGPRGYQGRPIAQVPTSVAVSGTAWTMVFHLPGR